MMEENNNTEEHLLLPEPRQRLPLWGVAGFVIVVFFLAFLLFFYNSQKEVIPEPLQENLYVFDNPFEDVELEAASVYVWDIVGERALFAKNENDVLPLASLAKIMSAMTASDLLPSFSTITINSESLLQEGDTGLFIHEEWRLRDLLDFSLIVSSNDAVHAIAGTAGAVSRGIEGHALGREEFINQMNRKAREIGLLQTRFANESGLDVSEEESGAYGTAKEMVKLFEYALIHYPNVLEATRYDSLAFSSLSNLSHRATNTNITLGNVPSIIASKTGYTDLSGGNLVIAFNVGISRPVIIAVLGSSYDGRFEDMLQLTQATIEYLENEKGKELSSVR